MTRGDLEGCKYEFMMWVVVKEEGIEMKDLKIEVIRGYNRLKLWES